MPEVIPDLPHDDRRIYPGAFAATMARSTRVPESWQSTLREVDPQTGEVQRSIDVPEEYYAEGLALVDDTLIQLTWKTGDRVRL